MLTTVDPTSQAPINAPIKLDDRYHTVFLKWNFSNPDHIPVGIPDRVRGSDAEEDRKHANRAIEKNVAELGKVGLVRSGRVDTGREPVFKNTPMTQVALTREGLRRSGYKLAKLHCYEHVQGEKSKWVVEAIYNRMAPGEKSVTLPAETTRALKALAERAAWFLYVYDNCDLKDASFDVNNPETWPTTGRTVTINCAGMTHLLNRDGSSNGQRINNLCLMRKGELLVESTTVPLTEEQELQQAAFELFGQAGMNPTLAATLDAADAIQRSIDSSPAAK